MRPAILLPEMVQAGAEAYAECYARLYPPTDIAVAVYLAMEAIREIYEMRDTPETVH